MSDDAKILAAKREGYVARAYQTSTVLSADRLAEFEKQAIACFPDPYTPREVGFGQWVLRINHMGVAEYREKSQEKWSSAIGIGMLLKADMIISYGDLAREYLAHRDGAKK